MTAKRRKKQGLDIFTLYVIFPLMLIDAYAFWRVHKSSEHWLTGMLSFSEPLSQLAWILAVNIAVIFILLARDTAR
ncbi:MAG: hypothetical protein GXP32_00190 [Kiritimatiellaeota bacterium]|nr:hypothetical protein [Kiritimatiellota bacterium]